MPIVPLLVAYLYCANLSLSGLALALSRYEQHSSEPQKMAGVPVYVGLVALALAVLVWLAPCVAAPGVVPSPLSTHAAAQP